MFLSLTLKNFKKHEQLHVDFTAGLNGIFGPNYKGKSTILYGLLFALGGASQVPGNRIARRGSDGRFSVEARLLINGNEYMVTRTKSTANLHVFNTTNLSPDNSAEPDGWGVLASGTTGVNDKIEELIGMPLKQWKELHFAKQKNAHSLLRYSAGNLQSLLRRLVGAEELDQVQKRLKSMADKEEGIIEGLPVIEHSAEECAAEAQKEDDLRGHEKEKRLSIEDNIRELDTNEQQGLKAIQNTSERVNTLTEQKGAAETYATRVDAATRGVEAAKGIVSEREELHSRAEAEFKKLDAQTDPEAASRIHQFEQLKIRRAAAERNAEQANARYDIAVTKVEKASALAAASKKAYDDLVAEHGDVEAKLQAANDSWQDSSSRRAVALQKVNDLEAAVAGAACPTCQRPFEDHDPAALESELQAATEALASVTGEMNDHQQASRILTQTLHGLNLAKTAAATDAEAVTKAKHAQQDCDGDRHDAQEELTAILGDENDLGLTDDDVAKLREHSNHLSVARQASGATLAELSKAKAALVSAEEALERVKGKGSPGDVAKMEADILALTATLKKDRETMGQLRAALQEQRDLRDRFLQVEAKHEREKDRWDQLKVQAEKAGQRRTVAEKRLARIKHLQKHLKDNAEGYMGKVWATFLAQASRVASQCTGGDIQGLARTEDGSFTYIEDGEEMQLEEASGAQEAIIGLAVQLALSSAAPCHLNLLLLDEPTADMDPNCSMATIAAMKALGQQVVFVSHQQTDNSLCDNAITL